MEEPPTDQLTQLTAALDLFSLLQVGMSVEHDSCDSSPTDQFTAVQFIFRAYAMPLTYTCGIFCNIVNILVYSRRPMRRHAINWFFLALSVSDLSVLISSFFVFSVPVYAEAYDNSTALKLSATLIMIFYPIAQSSLTASVYLTVLVAAHRYAAICHPFRCARFISSRRVVRRIVFGVVMLAFGFNGFRWAELTTTTCYSVKHQNLLPVVVPTEWMMGRTYTLVYRNGAYSSVMFFFPFSALIYLNVKIINAIRESSEAVGNLGTKETRKSEVLAVVTPGSTATSMLKKGNVNISTDRKKEQNISMMLVGIITLFMLFNVLAFVNNIMELMGAYGQSFIETLLVEVSALLVNLWGACTIGVYIGFSSKYRAVLKELFCWNKIKYRLCRKEGKFSSFQHETTQLLDTKMDDLRTRQVRSATVRGNLRVNENRRFSSRDTNRSVRSIEPAQQTEFINEHSS